MGGISLGKLKAKSEACQITDRNPWRQAHTNTKTNCLQGNQVHHTFLKPQRVSAGIWMHL